MFKVEHSNTDIPEMLHSNPKSAFIIVRNCAILQRRYKFCLWLYANSLHIPVLFIRSRPKSGEMNRKGKLRWSTKKSKTPNL